MTLAECHRTQWNAQSMKNNNSPKYKTQNEKRHKFSNQVQKSHYLPSWHSRKTRIFFRYRSTTLPAHFWCFSIRMNRVKRWWHQTQNISLSMTNKLSGSFHGDIRVKLAGTWMKFWLQGGLSHFVVAYKPYSADNILIQIDIYPCYYPKVFTHTLRQKNIWK